MNPSLNLKKACKYDGYQEVKKRPDAKAGVTWYVAMRPGKRKALDKNNEADTMIDKAEKLKAGVRGKLMRAGARVRLKTGQASCKG